MSDSLLYNEVQTGELLDRVAAQIVEAIPVAELRSAGLLGIHKHGVPFAHELAARIVRLSGIRLPVGTLDINMYRDDIGRNKTLPVIRETLIPFDVEGNLMILADDVLHTGRTIRAALDAITDFGRPKVIRLATILDRGQREVPIQPDFFGERCDIPADEWIQLRQTESGAPVLRVGKRKPR